MRLVIEDGLADARTPEERRFLESLPPGPPHLDVWPRADPDGTPWLCVSMDVVRDGVCVRVLRLDFDGCDVRGGWSPAGLNWDDGVRADDAGIDTEPPEGIRANGLTPEDAARVAGEWFQAHYSRLTADRLRRPVFHLVVGAVLGILLGIGFLLDAVLRADAVQVLPGVFFIGIGIWTFANQRSA